MASLKINKLSINNTQQTNNQVSEEYKIKTNDSSDILSLKGKYSINDLLVFATEHNCSDLYIKLFEQPYIARYGKIIKVPCIATTKDDWHDFYQAYILNELNAQYVRQKLLDTSLQIRIPEDSPNRQKFARDPFYRYRASFGFSDGKNTGTFRMIKPEQPTFDSINYNKQCIEALKQAYAKPSGINYFTGPTGSGKSTTMAACINTFTKPNGILDNTVFITLEDPIENIFYNTDSVKISQKELGKDFISFAMGIKASLREHPTHIIVGECRDKEVICAAIEASRTGHQTITTFHAADVPGTMNRLLYHLDNDKNLSLDLILQLNIILSQKMLKQDGQYLVDTQYLLFTEQVTKILVEVISNPNANIAVEVLKLIENPAFQQAGISKDWSYKHLH